MTMKTKGKVFRLKQKQIKESKKRATSRSSLPVLSEELRDLRTFKHNVAYFNTNYPKLKKKYSGEYVAICKRSVIAHNKNRRAVLEEVERLPEKQTILIQRVGKPEHYLVM